MKPPALLSPPRSKSIRFSTAQAGWRVQPAYLPGRYRNVDPIFIVGTERSGSNLLRAILNAHENICIPHPPHIMNELAHLVPRYGDLSQDKNFRRLIDHAVRVVELHFAPW